MKFENVRKLIIGICIGEFIGLCLLANVMFESNKIENIGVISDVKKSFKTNGSYENGYWNYYFLTKKGNKIWITHNINRKSLKSDNKMYENRKVKYDPMEPDCYFVLTKDDGMVFINFYYYLLTLPCIVLVFYYVLFPAWLEKRLLELIRKQKVKIKIICY